MPLTSRDIARVQRVKLPVVPREVVRRVHLVLQLIPPLPRVELFGDESGTVYNFPEKLPQRAFESFCEMVGSGVAESDAALAAGRPLVKPVPELSESDTAELAELLADIFVSEVNRRVAQLPNGTGLGHQTTA